MHDQNRKHSVGELTRTRAMIIVGYLFGTAGGLFLYPYLPLPALIGFAILTLAIGVLIFIVTRPTRS